MEMNFCRRCGAKLENEKGKVFRCENGHTIFLDSSPCVGVFLLTPDNKVWLAVRGQEPQIGKLDAPGGFVDGNENFEQAAVRELREELSLESDEYEPLTYLTSYFTDTYVYNGENSRNLTALFYSHLRTDRSLKPADDVADVKLFALDEINMADLHADDIRAGIEKLREVFLTSD